MGQYEINISKSLLSDIKYHIEQSKQQVSIEVNAAITMLYWNIGKIINDEILNNNRATYGQQIVQSLSKQLTQDYGSGWSEKHLRHCLRFAETISDESSVSALRRQLSWTHIKSIIYLDDPLKRMFYIEMCKIEKWSTRTLQERIKSML